MRAQGDSMRRLAETEAAVWQSEVILPASAAGTRADQTLGADFGDRMSVLTERAVIAMYHVQQTRAWTAGIIEDLEMMLAGAGLHSRPTTRRPCASSTSPATRASPRSRATRRRPRWPSSSAGSSSGVAQARRPGRQVARRRRDAALPEPGPGRRGGPRHGRRRGGRACRRRTSGCTPGRSSSRRATTTARPSTSPRASPPTRRPARSSSARRSSTPRAVRPWPSVTSARSSSRACRVRCRLFAARRPGLRRGGGAPDSAAQPLTPPPSGRRRCGAGRRTR